MAVGEGAERNEEISGANRRRSSAAFAVMKNASARRKVRSPQEEVNDWSREKMEVAHRP